MKRHILHLALLAVLEVSYDLPRDLAQAINMNPLS